MVNVCNNCGSTLGPNEKFCVSCGTKVAPPEPPEVSCSSCGTPRKGDSLFCTQCGARFPETSPEAAVQTPPEPPSAAQAVVTNKTNEQPVVITRKRARQNPATKAVSGQKKLHVLLIGALIVVALIAAGAVFILPGLTKKNSDYFAQGLGDAVADLSGLTSLLSPLCIEIIPDPNAAFDPAKSTTTRITFDLIVGSDSTHIDQTVLFNGKNGDTASTIARSVNSGDQTTQSLYFFDNVMIIDPAKNDPLIRHTIADTSGMRTAPVTERVDMVLTDRNKKLTKTEWKTGVKGYADALKYAEDEDYATRKAELSIAGKQIFVNAYTLTLQGENAYTALSEFMALLSTDAAYASYFESITARLDAFKQPARDAMDFTSTVYFLDGKVVGMDVQGRSGSNNVALRTLRFVSGHEFHFELELTAFDDVHLMARSLNVKSGGDNYSFSTEYSLNDKGAKMIEMLTLIGAGRITDDDKAAFNISLSYKFSGSIYGDKTNIAATGDLVFSRQRIKNGKQTTTSTRLLKTNVNGDGANVSFNAVTEQTEGSVAIIPPQNAEDPGVSTTTLGRLYKALDMNTTVQKYRDIPLNVRLFISSIPD